jgi:hypothetical protein
MKTIGLKLFPLIALLACCVTTNADTRINLVWTCQTNADKSMDDIRSANSNWVKFINANVKGGDITSSIVTPIVGDTSPGHFLYVDSFPNLATWTLIRAAEDSTEGAKIIAALDDVATCSQNRLYSAEGS